MCTAYAAIRIFSFASAGAGGSTRFHGLTDWYIIW